MSDVKLKLMQSQITHAIQLTNQSVLENPWIRPRPLKFELINQRSARWRNILYWVLIPWQTRTHCCGHIVVHDVSWTAQTEKHLVRPQNVSEQSQKHFLCPGNKICVHNKCCAREKHLCPRLQGPLDFYFRRKSYWIRARFWRFLSRDSRRWRGHRQTSPTAIESE